MLCRQSSHVANDVISRWSSSICKDLIMHSRVKDFWSITPSEIAARCLEATPVITSAFDNMSDIGVCLGLSLGPSGYPPVCPVETGCISIPQAVFSSGRYPLLARSCEHRWLTVARKPQVNY